MNMHRAFRTGLVAASFLAMLLASGCPPCDCEQAEDNGANVHMAPFSGRFGYGLSGPYGFLGSLTKDQVTDQAWRLEANFTFPTGGYTVDAPVILVAESYPEQVSVVIKVTPPAPDTIVTQMIAVVPVTADITASNGAKFSIRIDGAQDAACPDAVLATLKNEKDAWALESGATAPRLLLSCPSGIGEATIQLNPSCPLNKLLVGLRYDASRPFARLEGFEATNANGEKWSDPAACMCPGFIQVVLPEAALAPENGPLTLHWVDMYR